MQVMAQVVENALGRVAGDACENWGGSDLRGAGVHFDIFRPFCFSFGKYFSACGLYQLLS